jgi:hypothetical protein
VAEVRDLRRMIGEMVHNEKEAEILRIEIVGIFTIEMVMRHIDTFYCIFLSSIHRFGSVFEAQFSYRDITRRSRKCRCVKPTNLHISIPLIPIGKVTK